MMRGDVVVIRLQAFLAKQLHDEIIYEGHEKTSDGLRHILDTPPPAGLPQMRCGISSFSTALAEVPIATCLRCIGKRCR